MEINTLRMLQQTELRILSVIDGFCDKHGLKYSLCYGTAIGAVRHQGFIPWDDDIDIWMDRNDYEKFLSLWDEEHPVGYRIQDTSDDSETTINHSKIFQEEKLYCDVDGSDEKEEFNVFVDIFPMDRIPQKRLIQIIMKFIACLRLVYTRGYPITKKGKLFEYLSRFMLILPRGLKRKIRIATNHYVMKYRGLKDHYDYKSFSCPEELGVTFPAGILDNLIEVSFEGHMFTMVADYDKVLRITYGDYMQLPPEEERVCKHNPDTLEAVC